MSYRITLSSLVLRPNDGGTVTYTGGEGADNVPLVVTAVPAAGKALQKYQVIENNTHQTIEITANPITIDGDTFATDDMSITVTALFENAQPGPTGPVLKIDGKEVTSIVIDGKEVTQIEADGKIIYKKIEPVLPDYFYIENVTNDVATSQAQTSYGFPDDLNLYYSANKIDWTKIGTNTVITFQPLSKVYFRGKCPNGLSIPSMILLHIHFNINKEHNIGGAFETLIDWESPETVTTLPEECFGQLFYNDTELVDASAAYFISDKTNTGANCFSYMFYGCSKLETINVPNIDSWDTSKFNYWVGNAAGSQATNPQMIFQTQALLDACPSGQNGSGSYAKILAS